MNHYPHHIGDFRSATRHLTTVERALYRECLDEYYDTERPLPGDDFDKLARRLLAVTDDEKKALKAVLEEFFTLTPEGWRHTRCDEEIHKYQGLREKASEAGRASAAARKKGKKPRATPVERPLNDRTTNQEPRTKNQLSTEEDLSSSAAPPIQPSVDNLPAKDQAWALGFPLLMATGIDEPRARSSLGRLLRQCGDAAVLQAVRKAIEEKPVEPLSWITATAKAIATQRPAGKPGAQPSRHHGISQQDFNEGVTDAGHF